MNSIHYVRVPIVIISCAAAGGGVPLIAVAGAGAGVAVCGVLAFVVWYRRRNKPGRNETVTLYVAAPFSLLCGVSVLVKGMFAHVFFIHTILLFLWYPPNIYPFTDIFSVNSSRS